MFRRQKLSIHLIEFATETFPAHEIPFDHSQRIALETNTITDSYETQASHLPNHESFLICPGKRPIKVGSNYAVSIHIYFDNFVRRKNENHHQHDEDNGDIYLHITTDEGFHDNYDNRSNQPNNRINSHKLINGKNAIKDQNNDRKNKTDNKSSETQMKIDLIESNHNAQNDINRIDGKAEHYVRIYQQISNQQTSDSKKTEKAESSQNYLRAK